MQTLEVTDEQYAFVQQLREAISAQVVGPYGYVRERDAVQFLIDNLDGKFEPDGEFEAPAEADVAAALEDLPEGRAGNPTAIAYDEGTETIDPADGTDDDSEDPPAKPADDGVDDETTGEEDAADEDAGDGPDAEEATDEEATGEEEGADEEATGDDDSDGDDGGSGDDDHEDDDGAGSADGDGAADDDEMLDAMMNLLDTHDDKWEEADAADYRYSVTLPDGSVENVQTKDDVRALLFKNYQ